MTIDCGVMIVSLTTVHAFQSEGTQIRYSTGKES